MNKDLDKLREIFLAGDVDEETRADNEERIREWETTLRENNAFLGWQSHDITRQISQQAKQSYKDISLQLATNRALTDQQRYSLWGKQDACLFILSLTEKDTKGPIDQIHREIKMALAV